MLSARTATDAAVWASAGVRGTGLFLYATPMLEARMAPVLSDQHVEVDADDRSQGRIWVKNRYAQPIVVTIMVEGTAVEFPTITQRQRDGRWGPADNGLCAAIPVDLDRVLGPTVRGQINYRMPAGLWTIVVGLNFYLRAEFSRSSCPSYWAVVPAGAAALFRWNAAKGWDVLPQ